MLDPLQNILDCAWTIQFARSQLNHPNQMTRWLAQIGELDHICEIRRQLEELEINKHDRTAGIGIHEPLLKSGSNC